MSLQRLLFYALTEAELYDHELFRRGLADIARSGFDSIYLEFRNTRASYDNPRMRRAVVAFCRHAAALGLPVVIDAHYGRTSREMLERDPALFTDALTPVWLPLRDGRFTVERAGEALHESIERCWLIDEDRDRRLRRAREITDRLVREDVISEGGGCAMTEAKGVATVRATWRVRGVAQGQLLVLFRQRYEYAYLDLGHPRLRHYLDRRLATSRGLRVAGFAWDEPQFGFAFWPHDGRSVSERLYRVFRKKFGYDLRERLLDLWCDGPGRDAPLTRYHYAELLESELAGLEKYFVRRARQCRPGPVPPFLGIHRTMHEELADDFTIGCVDYFRHNRATSAGFTDSIFEREDSMVAMLHLARALGAESASGLAYNNSWGFRPTEAHHDYFLSLMAALNVRWLGHAYRSSGQFGPGYPDHPLWRTLPAHLAEHRRVLAALAGAVPAADTAVLWHWPSLATYPGNYFHVHRRNLLLLGLGLTLSQVQFRFASTAALERGGLAQYRRLIVPWPDLLSARAWARLEQLAAAGVELVLFGPPAARTTAGEPLGRSFARLCGIKPIGTAQYRKLAEADRLDFAGRSFPLAPQAIEPNYRSNPVYTYPDHFKAFHLRPLRGTAVVARHGGRVVGVRRGNVSYFACELPHYQGLIAAVLAARPQLPGLLLFEYDRGADQLLAGVGRWNKPITGTIRWGADRLVLRNCKLFVAARRANGRVRLIVRTEAD